MQFEMKIYTVASAKQIDKHVISKLSKENRKSMFKAVC